MKILSIIPARGGSKRVVNKNLRQYKGMPLIAWSINAAKSSKLIDQVIVSTDCNSILATAKKFGAIALKRPSDLADDFTSAYEVARYVYLNQIEQTKSSQNIVI